MRQEQKDQLMFKSALTIWCETMDKKIEENMLYAPESIREMVKVRYKKDPNFIRNAFKQEQSLRAKFRQNLLISVEGEQSKGKSMFSSDLVLNNSYAFGVPFSFSNNLFYIPDDFMARIGGTFPRSTNWIDEVKKKNVGTGSRRLELEMQDYDEMSRKTQKSIIRCSPIIPDSNSYYFNFFAYDLTRKINQKCLKCPDVNLCLMGAKQTITLCKEVPFYERLGYPEKIIFSLETKNIDMGMPILRGYYVAPMPPPDFVLEYDKYKDAFLEELEKKGNDKIIDTFKEIARRISTERKADLINVDTGKIAHSKLIEAVIYETVGMRTYTKGEIEILKVLVRAELIKQNP